MVTNEHIIPCRSIYQQIGFLAFIPDMVMRRAIFCTLLILFRINSLLFTISRQREDSKTNQLKGILCFHQGLMITSMGL